MYIPHAFRADEFATLVDFMRAHSFATLVSTVDGAPFASHIPLVVAVEGEQVVLTGHLAKANPQWRAFGGAESLAIFSGPHAFISPSLYASRESVPTWNYMAVHAYGVPQIRTFDGDGPEVRAMLEAMLNTYEPAYRLQWEALSEKYRTGMMQGIVAFELRVSRLEGKAKLSQNRSRTDRVSVAQALAASGDPAAAAIGSAMLQALAEEEVITR